MNDPGHFKAPYIPKERIWQEADRLRAAHPAGRELPVKVPDLAEFDLHPDLVPWIACAYLSPTKSVFGAVPRRLRRTKTA